MIQNTTTISQYLIDALHKAGVNHVFGIPGDYVINFFSKFEESPIKPVGTCSEQGVAFAADAYARFNGIGALCVTYCVGGLNTVNAVAGAYAEKTPLVVISGAPGINERDKEYLLHHCVKDFDTQYEVFKNITVASTQLTDPLIAVYEIDRVIEACIKHKRPVYIELPRDMVNQECVIPPKRSQIEEKSNQKALAEAIKVATEMIKNAKKPIFVGGVEVKRYHLEEEFLELLETTKFPFVTTFLGKAVIDEAHPQFVGVYMGKFCDDTSRQYVEDADCTIMLGTMITDTEMATARIDSSNLIMATSDQLSIRHHYYKQVLLKDFIKGLTESLKDVNKSEHVFNHRKEVAYVSKGEEKLKVSRFFERLNSFLDEKSVVVCDVGDCLFGSAELKIPKNSPGYVGPAYYTSMGYAVPGAIGAKFACPESRPIVIVGDGAFQMTGFEASCYSYYDQNPIVFVINNKGYTTQRFLKDGNYNNINNWAYHKLPEVVGKGLGLEVSTEGELEEALDKAKQNTESFTIINLHIDKMDTSDVLHRLTSHFSKVAVQ